jgi:hypothetical protein
MPLTYNNATTITRDSILVKKPIDTTLHTEPLFAFLMQNKFPTTPADSNSGGYEFCINLKYARNGINFYNGDDLPAVSGGVQKYTKAIFNWRFGEAHGAIKHTDWLANQGIDSQLINLMSGEVDDCMLSLRQGCVDTAFTAQAGNAFDSIYDMYKGTTYGGITRTLGDLVRNTPTTNNQWWSPYQETSASSAANMKTLLHVEERTHHYGNSAADILFMAYGTWDILFDLLYGKTGYLMPMPPKALDLGFQGLAFDGMPIVIDPGVTAGDVWFGNSAYMGLVLHPLEPFKMDDEGWHRSSDNSLTVSVRFLVTGDFICDNCGALGIAHLV